MSTTRDSDFKKAYCTTVHVQCLLCTRAMLHILTGAVVGGGKFTTATHNPTICSLPESESIARAVKQATATLALLHPCPCGCMKYSVWEAVERWGREYISELEVRYCLKLLMVKSVSQRDC